MDQTLLEQRLAQDVFDADDLDQISKGTFMHPDTPQLPDNSGVGWRLFDWVKVISRDDATGGILTATGTIDPEHPIFKDHFPSFKVLPGLYLTDQLMQLVGLMMGLKGIRGQGLAVKVGEAHFMKAARPNVGLVTFLVEGTKFLKGPKQSKQWADGKWYFDSDLAGEAKGLHVKILHPA